MFDECFLYGSSNGCDNNCPVLLNGECGVAEENLDMIVSDPELKDLYPTVVDELYKIRLIENKGNIIVLHVTTYNNIIEELKRLCFVAGIEYNTIKYEILSDMSITLKRLKELNRILPELKKHFPNNIDELQQYKEFFGDV